MRFATLAALSLVLLPMDALQAQFGTLSFKPLAGYASASSGAYTQTASFSLNKSSAGALTLSNAGPGYATSSSLTFSGGTSVSNGGVATLGINSSSSGGTLLLRPGTTATTFTTGIGLVTSSSAASDFVISGGSTYSGATAVANASNYLPLSGGTIAGQGTLTIGAAPFNSNLLLSGVPLSNSLTINAGVNNPPPTLSAGTISTSGAILSATATLNKTGAGTLVLSNAATYSGATTLSNLTVNSGGLVLSPAIVPVGVNGTLALSGGRPLTLNLSQGTTLTLNTGTISTGTISTGSLTSGTSTTTGSTGSTLTISPVNATGNVVAGAINLSTFPSATNSITLTGPGVVNLSNGGMLQLNSSAAAPTSTPVTTP